MTKINISIPEDLLGQVDEVAQQLRMSRSGLVQEAAAEYILRVREEEARAARRASIDRAVRSARELATRVEPFDTVSAVRAERDRDGRSIGER